MTGIEHVVGVLNLMRHERVIEDYAIGLDMQRFESILARHGLASAWERFRQQFLTDQP